MNAASHGTGGPESVFPQRELSAIFARWVVYPRIALAVSGGADSVALMLLARAWLDLRPAAGLQITVLTVDHQLREASAAEAQWVKSEAEALGFRHETVSWEGEKPLADLQAEARRARYDLMTAYCRVTAIPALATAHTSDDQAETVLMRLARGSGLDGLSAMDDVFRRTGVDILRPFLGIPRRRIEAFLHAQGQSWLDDPSNDDGRFERVRVRRALRAMPSLGLSPVALALSARRLRRARDALEAATTAFLSAHATLHLAGFAHIGLPHLFEAHEEVGLRALNRMIATVGGDSSAPLRLSKLEACFETLRTARRGATLGGCRLLVKGSALLIIREIGRMDATAERPMLPGDTCLWDARFIVTYGADEPYSAILRPLGADGYRAIKVANGHFGGVPRLAALTLPSLWAAGALRYAPFADFAGGSPAEWSAHSRAQFVNALAVPAARDEAHDRC